MPEAPDNSYTVFGTTLLHFRVLADAGIKVTADSVALPRRAQSKSTSGWYEPDATTVTASRGLFLDIAVQLPASAVAVSKMNFPIEFLYDTVTSTPQPELRVVLHLQGRDPNYVKSNPPPGRPGDLHPESPTDPDVNLSIHPARVTPRKPAGFRQDKEFLRLPVDSILTRVTCPLCSTGITPLPRYYEAVRP